MATVTRVLPWRRGARRPAAEIAPLLECYHQRHRDGSPDLIVRAFDVAAKAHEGQMRLSGEPYIRHPLAVANIVARLGLDDVTIAASLLHDAVEDTDVALAVIEADFGAEVARIVDGVTKLDRVQYDTREQQQAASVRKMIVAIARDLRVLIIKLADRLHNLRTLAVLPVYKQHYIARETLDVYAPLAHRLGMQDVKQQIEDLAFAALEPRRYAEIDQMVQQRAPERDIYLEQVLGNVESRLAELGISASVTGRPKHLWSIYEKMVVKGRSFEEIFDLVGIRVQAASVRDCYAALGSIHATWRPVQGRFKDYIAMPKFNLYQSLHTTVVGPQGKTLEVQIRTRQMHDRAEYGVASHWEYKDDSPSQEMAWLSRIVDWQQGDVGPGGVHVEPQDRARHRRGLRVHAQGQGHRTAGGGHAGGLRLQHPHRRGPRLRGRQSERSAGGAGQPPAVGRRGRDLHHPQRGARGRAGTGSSSWPAAGPPTRSSSGTRASAGPTPSRTGGTI